MCFGRLEEESTGDEGLWLGVGCRFGAGLSLSVAKRVVNVSVSAEIN